MTFAAPRFAMPGYAQLASAAQAVRTGATDGAEIGAGHAQHAVERAELLTDRVADQLPLGVKVEMVWR